MSIKYNTPDVETLRLVYKEGTRVVLLAMEDPWAHPDFGDEGTVKFVDDAGQIHVSWDSGSSLALIPGVDSFRIIA